MKAKNKFCLMFAMVARLSRRDYWNVKEEALLARSPVAWPEKLCATTPILLLHGTADWRVHPGESMRMPRLYTN